MDGLRQYIFSLVITAIICGILTSVIQDGLPGKLLKLVCGVVMTVSLLSPIAGRNLSTVFDFSLYREQEMNCILEEGLTMAQNAKEAVILERTEAYILDKAASMGLQLQVDVILKPGEFPVPESAVFSGAVSPEKKQELEVILERALGIPKEALVWTQ